jgi:hypothetical protein
LYTAIYRKTGMADQWIMRRINMVGEYAYLRYTAEFSDVAPQEVPRFASSQAARKFWALTLPEDNRNLEDELEDEEDDHGVRADL